MITDALEKAFETAKKRNWDRIYFAIDIHDTIIPSNYCGGDNIPNNFYEDAIDVLQLLSDRNDIILILYTCSKDEDIKQYRELFKSNKIYFDYVNENPEVCDSSYGCYEKKFYFNVILDDKAGFVPKRDWKIINNFIIDQPILKTQI